MADTAQVVIDQYINSVSHEMTCSGKRKRTLLSRLRGDIEELADIRGNSFDEAAIESHFGKPKDVAAGFLETTDLSEVKKKLSVKRAVVICVAVTCIIALIGILGYIAYEYVQEERFAHGYAVETPVYNIEDVPDDVLNPPEDARTY